MLANAFARKLRAKYMAEGEAKGVAKGVAEAWPKARPRACPLPARRQGMARRYPARVARNRRLGKADILTCAGRSSRLD